MGVRGHAGPLVPHVVVVPRQPARLLHVRFVRRVAPGIDRPLGGHASHRVRDGDEDVRDPPRFGEPADGRAVVVRRRRSGAAVPRTGPGRVPSVVDLRRARVRRVPAASRRLRHHAVERHPVFGGHALRRGARHRSLLVPAPSAGGGHAPQAVAIVVPPSAGGRGVPAERDIFRGVRRLAAVRSEVGSPSRRGHHDRGAGHHLSHDQAGAISRHGRRKRHRPRSTSPGSCTTSTPRW